MISNNSPTAYRPEKGTLFDGAAQIKNIRDSAPGDILKQGIWAYFFLLLFEGALRKWFLPGLATPLLLVRDPLALWLIVMASRRGLLKFNPYLLSMGIISILSFFAAILAGHGNIIVASFGVRILILHFPLIFVIGNVFNPEDVKQMGKVTLWISIPMTVLIAAQFFSPQSAWVNRGVGGDSAGAGFSGAMGYYRPPATFSFTNGTSLFYSFVACFLLYFWLNNKLISKWILWLSTAALFSAIPLSISRGLFFQVMIIVIFTIVASSTRTKNFAKIIAVVAALAIIFVVFSQTSIFQTSTKALTTRFENASHSEGGLKGTLVDRYLGGLVSSITGSDQIPFWGYGLGMGSNVGSKLLSGSVKYLISEAEWGRIVGEIGPLLGLWLIFTRLAISWNMAVRSFRAFKRDELLPWILLAFALLLIPQGNTAQPTGLGFLVLTGGLLLAALKVKRPVTNKKPQPRPLKIKD